MPEQALDSLLEIDGVQESTLENFREAGFDSLGDVALATRNDLRNVGSLDTSTAVNILRFLEREGYREPREVTENQQKLQQLLQDLFQFDAADLDFGIYRILNQRRDIIEDFLEDDLIRTVHDALDEVATEERAELQDEVEEARVEVVEQLNENVFTSADAIKEEFRDFGVAQDYIAAKERLERYEVAEETEARIFNDLHRFFSRFYDRGDFHTKRRFSSQDAKFMVPYNGEEVFLHWANRDQYYVKTSEHFTTYRFNADDLTVEFTVEDANVPQDNVKGDERYFILGTDPVSWDEEEQKLTITFQYRLISEDEEDAFLDTYNEVTGDGRQRFSGKKNTIICTALHHDILDHLEASLPREPLQQEEDGESVLMHHLNRYTSENTMDYFVHKDLGGFLRNELDYYIQNEILNTNELINADTDRDPHSLLRARVIRQIADRIITFLDQIESFQKRLFEKKKFVTQTDYMVTLDKVPELLYNDILENEKQLDQWTSVYGIDDWETDLKWMGDFNREFLDNHPYLMIDTGLFNDEFKMQLLESFENIEEETDGVLFNSENLQALSIIGEKYRRKVKCTYLDPPYNTGGDGFLYKDNYQHSSWLSMMSDRLELARNLMGENGGIFAQIGDEEQTNLKKVLEQTFGSANFRNSIIVRRGIKNVQSQFDDISSLAVGHDTIFFFSKNVDARFPKLYKDLEEGEPGKWDTFWRGTDRPTMRYELFGQEPDEGQWRWTEERTRQAIENYEKYREQYDSDDHLDEYYIQHLQETGEELDFVREGEEGVPQYYVPPRNYKLMSTLWMDVRTRGDFTSFSTEKHTELVETIVDWTTDDDGIVLDFFAGSGSTGHAVMNLNHENDEKYKYILIELGEHFDTVLRPRIMRIAFSNNWSDGLPQDRDGQSHMVKYHRIESYEDALNNVVLEEPKDEEQQQLVEDQREEYVSGYMLDFEAEGPSLMEPVSFEHPFEYELEIEENGTGRKPVTVDLVETFHYLLGAEMHGFETYDHQDRKYVVTRCSVEQENSTDSVLTVWRDANDLNLEQERDWFAEQFETGEFDQIYINTESFVPDAEPVEVTFKELMEAGHNGAE